MLQVHSETLGGDPGDTPGLQNGEGFVNRLAVHEEAPRGRGERHRPRPSRWENMRLSIAALLRARLVTDQIAALLEVHHTMLGRILLQLRDDEGLQRFTGFDRKLKCTLTKVVLEQRETMKIFYVAS